MLNSLGKITHCWIYSSTCSIIQIRSFNRRLITRTMTIWPQDRAMVQSNLLVWRSTITQARPKATIRAIIIRASLQSSRRAKKSKVWVALVTNRWTIWRTWTSSSRQLRRTWSRTWKWILNRSQPLQTRLPSVLRTNSRQWALIQNYSSNKQ